MRVRVSTSNALFYIQASHDVDTVRFTIRKPDTRVLLILPPSVFLSKYTRSLINDRAPCASLRAEVTLAKGRKLGNGISFSRERKRDKRWSRLTREFVAQRATARREGGLDESGDTRVQGKHNSLPPPDFSILTLQSVPRTAHFSSTAGSLSIHAHIHTYIVWTGAQRRTRAKFVFPASSPTMRAWLRFMSHYSTA